jgi:7,8-dihydropterin-6-yl-methyl-4-(beta-D-ribofuranosyl)aminobenzene 5'-phosphate synthase
MPELTPVDTLDIQVLVDNSTDGLSTTPANVENEFAFATRRGLRASSGRCLCCARYSPICRRRKHVFPTSANKHCYFTRAACDR